MVLQTIRTYFRTNSFFYRFKKLCDNPTVHGCRFDPWVFWTSTFIGKTFPWKQFDQGNGFSPNVIAPILVGLMWVFILDPHMGLVNAFLQQIGLESWQQEWIGGQTLTPYCVAFGLYLAGAWVLCYDFLGWFKNNLSGYL